MNKAMKNDIKPIMKVFFKDRGKVLFKNAITGDATLATKEKGEEIFKLLTERMIELINNFRDEKYYY